MEESFNGGIVPIRDGYVTEVVLCFLYAINIGKGKGKGEGKGGRRTSSTRLIDR